MADIIDLHSKKTTAPESTAPEFTPASLLKEMLEDASNIKALVTIAETDEGIGINFSSVSTAQLVVMAKILDMEVQERLHDVSTPILL